MTPASFATIDRSSTASSSGSRTRLWWTRCAASWKSCKRRARTPHRTRACGLLALLPLLWSCGSFEYEGWLDRPIPIDLNANVPVLPLSFGGQLPIRAMIDTGSPLTIVHRDARTIPLTASGDFEGYQLHLGLTQDNGDVRLYDASRPDVARFVFRQVDVVDLPLSPIGLDEPTPVEGVLGADLLSRFSIHLQYDPPTLSFRDIIADTGHQLASDCDASALLTEGGYEAERCFAVFGTPRRGGGTMFMGAKEIDIKATRLAVPLCLVPERFEPAAQQLPLAVTGVPATGLIATGVSISLISQSAYQRIKAAVPSILERGEQVLHLPTGPQKVELVEIPRLALVSDRTRGLGACEELYRRRRLLAASAGNLSIPESKSSGAAVALAQGNISMAVLDDASSIWQGLRHELRPLVPDIDVLLATSILSLFEVDLDYPSGRTILRCRPDVSEAHCRTTPSCNSEDTQPLCIRR